MTTKIKKMSQGYGYKYTELSTIHDELEKQNITYYQFVKYVVEADADYIYTVLTIDGDEKAPLQGCRVITGELAGGNAAQEQGSALTYARRYSLLMALGWATEDDDGASVTAKPATKRSSGGRLDFDKLKERLETLTTEDEVIAAREKTLEAYPNITEKQRSAVMSIFRDKLDHINYGDEKHENVKAYKV